MVSFRKNSLNAVPLELTSSNTSPKLGKPIAYIMSRFPKLSETFILREMLELEKQGQPIVIFPLLRVQQPVCHAEVHRLIPRVQYTPFLSLAILSANFHYLRRSSRQYLKMLWSALRGNWGSVNLFMGAIGIFPKSAYLARLIEEQGIWHVHAHFATHPALAALIISELTGISFSFTAHAHDIFVDTKMLGEKIRKARVVVTISTFNKQYLLRLCPETPADKIRVIHCGIESERYGKKRGCRKDNRFTILCVASLEPYKGIPYLVKACGLLKSRLSNYRCLIVGEGKERKRIERLIADLGLREVVILLGGQPQDKVAALLTDVDLFVLPSVVAADGQMEGIPVALMEVMASGLPVVSTRLSGIPELVQDGVTGLLVPPGDEQALAEAMALLYQRARLRQEMGHRGRERVSAEFDLTTNVAKLRSLFSIILYHRPETRNWKLEINETITTRTSKYFLGSDSNGASVAVHLGRRIGGHDSDVYEVTVNNADRDKQSLILKLHRPFRVDPEKMHEEARKCAQREHEALSFLWREFSHHSNRFAVPRPLHYFPESAGLLMEKCQGQRLDEAFRWARLLKTRSQRRLLCQQVRACGEWLGLFHRITERGGNPFEVYRRIERDFRHELNTCCELGLDPELVQYASRMFEEKKIMALSGDHKVVGHHCDFGPHNVFLSPDRITVIDFEGLQDGIIYNDISYFLGMIESTSFYHLSPDLSIRIRESFLEGYAPYERANQKQLDVFMLIAMVKLMAHSPLLKAAAAGWRDRWKRKNSFELYTSWFRERVA